MNIERFLPKPVTVLYSVTFIDTLSYAVIIPFIPFLILKAGGTAAIGGVAVALHSFAVIVFSPWLGRAADRFGKRPVLLLTLAGTAASYCAIAVSRELAVLFIARGFAGAMAGNIGIVQATVIDMLPQGERGKAISRLTGFSALGYVVGPLVAIACSMIALKDPSGAACLFAVGAALVSLFAVAIGLPKILPGHAGGAHRARPGWRSYGAALLGLLLAASLLSLSQSGLSAMTGFWSNRLFAWHEREVSALVLVVSAAVVCVQLFLLPFLFRRWGPKDVIAAASVAGLLSVVALALSGIFVIPSLVMISAAVLFSAIAAAQTGVTTSVAQRATEASSGGIMSLSTSADAAGRVVGPPLFGQLFIHAGPNAVFAPVFAIAVSGCAWTALWLLGQFRGARRAA